MISLSVEGVDTAIARFGKLEAVAHEAAVLGAAKGAATVEGRAKARAPVDTGRLRDSIHTARDADGAELVGTEVEYARFVEFGTVNMAAEPFLRPAAAGAAGEVTQAVADVLAKGIAAAVGL